MLVVGLTGNIGSGKSTVAHGLVARGARLIDADVLARDAVAPGRPALAAIVARWGGGMLAADGSLDRAALRRVVFANPVARAALEAIVHPEVEAMRRELLLAARARDDRIVVCDIPLLFEARLEHLVDVVLLVDAPRETRLARLVTSRGLPAAEAEAMIGAQLPSNEKRARADFVIDNDSTLDALERRVQAAWEFISSRERAQQAAQQAEP